MSIKTLVKTYRFRLSPNKAQQEAMLRQAGACRFVYNWGLARRKEHYAETGKGLTYNQQAKELTSLKQQPGMEWLNVAECNASQQSLKDLDRAYASFFARRAKFPRFKVRHRSSPSFRNPARARVNGDRIWCPKIGWLKMRGFRPLDGTAKGSTYKRDACGHWYVTIVVHFEMPDVALAEPDQSRAVGLDAGLKDFLILSTGEKVSNPRFYRKMERKLRRAQKTMSRRKPGSKRRQKAKLRVARIHRKTANCRKDFLHKLSTDIVRRFDVVCTEDLCVKGLAKTKLAKSFMDAAHGEFRRQIEYKCEWNRKHFVKVGRFFPSSKTCRSCGAVNGRLTLTERQWVCPSCNVVLDRDLNAARNILGEGLKELAARRADSQNARGASVRPSARVAVGVEPRNSQ